MKPNYKLLLTLFMALVVQLVFAQTKTITGTVIDEQGIPLPGVNILVKGSSSGTQTDFDGNYSIQASSGDILVYSYVGFTPQEEIVGPTEVIDITLTAGEALEEVIVTAQGITRERKALGYAVAEVDSEQLESRAEGDIGRVLSGKASGVNITAQSGLSGSGTNITIRGLSSFSGSNQPLFIVDGVPFSSDTNAQGDFVEGNSGGSRFFDLDPNNIANVNVLKGLAAATLYGTAGRNGVILITTKNGSSKGGRKKNEVTINTSVFFNEIGSVPDYTDKFGNGFDQSFGWFFSNWGPSFSEDGVAGWGNDAAIDANGTIEHPYSTASSGTGIPQAFPEFQGVRYAWKPYNSVEDFFRTGTVTNTTVSASGASDDGTVTYNVSGGHLEDEGFVPENKVIRNTLGIGGRAKLTNNFTVSATMNFTRTDLKSPPVSAGDGNSVFAGGGSSVFSNVFFTPRSVDLSGLPYQNPLDGSSVYYRQSNNIQNPNWTLYNTSSQQITNRVFGNTAVTYDFTENLNLTYRLGIDVYSENNVNYQNKGGVTDNTRVRSGFYDTYNNTNYIWDHNVTLNGDYDLSDKLGLSFNLGATTRRTVFDQNGVSSSGQQVYNVLRHFNFQLQDEIQFYSEQNIAGVYGQAELDYDSYLYLTLAARNDWVSNLSQDNRSIGYPSASVSFLPTAAFEGMRGSKVLNFLKLRAGYGTSANFPSGYPVATRTLLDTQAFIDDGGSFVTTNTTDDNRGNPDLKPETLTELEFGIESRWWNNRINLSASYFSRVTKDLIVNRDLDASSAFTSTSTNIGEINVKGLEIDMGVDVFDNREGFSWNLNANFSTIDPVVKDLGADTDIIVYSGFTNLGNAAIPGRPLGTIVGSRILRNDNGDLVTNSQGDYVVETGQFEIGNPNPDYTLNVGSSMTYKNISFNFLLSHVSGGDIYSQTIATLLGRGLTTDTEDRLNSFILPGVNQDTGNPNTVQINNSQYYFDNILFGPNELQVYDGSVVRLQEVSLGYSLPASILDKTPFGSLKISVSGYNLWFDAYNTPDGINFDPNVAALGVGNGQGFDFMSGPSSKRYGLSVQASF
jgi:TonB-linked SusC/RagA family outer membrane protein